MQWHWFILIQNHPWWNTLLWASRRWCCLGTDHLVFSFSYHVRSCFFSMFRLFWQHFFKVACLRPLAHPMFSATGWHQSRKRMVLSTSSSSTAIDIHIYGNSSTTLMVKAVSPVWININPRTVLRSSILSVYFPLVHVPYHLTFP